MVVAWVTFEETRMMMTRKGHASIIIKIGLGDYVPR